MTPKSPAGVTYAHRYAVIKFCDRGYTTDQGSELEEALASLRSKYEECGWRSSV